MRIRLGGHLAFYDRAKRSRFELHLEADTSVLDLIRELGIPEAEIALTAVDGKVVALQEAQVSDADCLDLYPPMSGG
jgi:sulfur carrier protein ThiS